MKNGILLFWFIYASFFVVAQDFNWGKRIGGTSTDEGLDIAIDNNANVYTVGSFINTVDFDPGSGVFNLTSSGSKDIFILKQDTSGNFKWARRVGGSFQDYGHSLAVDDSGNVYVTGEFGGVVDFDPGVGVFNLTSNGGIDIFVLKLDSLGDFVWAVSMGSASNYDTGYALEIDNLGSICITGRFFGTIDFDPGAGVHNLTSTGSTDVFFLKLDSDGNLLNAIHVGGTSEDMGRDLKIDTAGNIYIIGEFKLVSDFDPGLASFNLTSAGGYDIFILKLDPSCNFLWARRLGNSYAEACNGIAVDFYGNSYCTGRFFSTVDFDPGPGTYNLSSSAGNDVFLEKLDADGNFVWALQIGSSGYDSGETIMLDANRNIYLAGTFMGTVDFNPGPGIANRTTAGFAGEDVFVVKLDSLGGFLWVVSMGGASVNDNISSVAIDSMGSIYLAGSFQSTIDLDPGPGNYFLTSAGVWDIFIEKLNNLIIPCVQADIPTLDISASGICALGDSVVLTVIAGNLNDATDWVWYNTFCGGTEIGTGTSVTVFPTANEFYFVRAVGGCVNPGSCSGTPIFVSQISSSASSMDEIFGLDGSIDLMMAGGILPYSYQWTGPLGFNSTNQDPMGLTAGLYTAQIIDANGCGDSISVLVNSQVGFYQNQFEFYIFPNPTSNLITLIKKGNSDTYRISLRNLLGEIIYLAEMNESILQLDLSAYEAGIYFVEIGDGNSIQVQRIVKE